MRLAENPLHKLCNTLDILNSTRKSSIPSYKYMKVISRFLLNFLKILNLFLFLLYFKYFVDVSTDRLIKGTCCDCSKFTFWDFNGKLWIGLQTNYFYYGVYQSVCLCTHVEQWLMNVLTTLDSNINFSTWSIFDKNKWIWS